jgi:hypothetical protein
MMAGFVAEPLLVMIVSLGTFSALFGHTLTASVAFPTLNYLNILRNPLVQFPDGAKPAIGGASTFVREFSLLEGVVLFFAALNWVLVEGKIAGERISMFLQEGTAVEYRTLRRSSAIASTLDSSSSSSSSSSTAAVEIVGATFRWDEPRE